ncbi:MAG: peptidyl-prolyl cis-trans isomerase [Deltaproteobacteria bacterium]|jgi:peptidyl-prolyl cis-trans isomerase B (cyclophilin B)|nr:peptidyl-prolyl cis-trans isomerase [Deltaproteobacteria bacterium]
MYKFYLRTSWLYLLLFAFSASSALAASPAPLVRLETSLGDMVIELNMEKAPKTCTNFLQYVRDGAYNGTIFHRVIDGFMIQGGGFDTSMKQRAARPPIVNEADNGLKNSLYTVAMARTGDPHSATSQFFINVSDNAFLDHSGKTAKGWGYCVFGKVIQGMEVVDKIKATPTRTKGIHENVPSIPVVIYKAAVL